MRKNGDRRRFLPKWWNI